MKKYLFLILFSINLFSFFEEPWGKDSDITYKKEEKIKKQKPSILAKIANGIILFHQNMFSPIDGPRSNFRPTSSRYMQLAMKRYGFFKGYIMGCDRLLRENNEKWVYRTITINNVEYKYDPAVVDKYSK